MESLAMLARDDHQLQLWLIPALRSHLDDERMSVAKRAARLLSWLEQA
jgi:hypothetical protein